MTLTRDEAMHQRLEALRRKLEKVAAVAASLTAPDVVACSQSLDQLIMTWCRAHPDESL